MGCNGSTQIFSLEPTHSFLQLLISATDNSAERSLQPQGTALPEAMPLPRGQSTAMMLDAGLQRPDLFASTRNNYEGLSYLQGSSKDELKSRLLPRRWAAFHFNQFCLPCVLISQCSNITRPKHPFAYNSLSENLFPREHNTRSKASIYSNEVNTMEKNQGITLILG